jgi:hypothetical protein
MRRFVLSVAVVAFLAIASAGIASAQAPLPKVFPDQFGPWKATSFPNKIKSDEEQTQFLKEAGAVDAMSREYSNGTRRVGISLYELRDPSGAYAVLTYFTPVATTGAVHGPGAESAGSHDVPAVSPVSQEGMSLRLFQVGNFVVQVVADENSIEEVDQKTLADAIRKEADPTPLPPIRTYLPAEGRVWRTERYALGPFQFETEAKSLAVGDFAALTERVGFASGAEAMFARYNEGMDEAVLLLVDYPTPQLAELHLRHLRRGILSARQRASVERKGSLLSIVLRSSSEEFAAKLRSAVNYETQVTWNEPSATATDPPWSTVLGKIFIGTGIFMVVAIVMGVAFGGVRVVTKRLFPGKVFDRPEQIEVLQLGLSGKPIDPRDLY